MPRIRTRRRRHITSFWRYDPVRARDQAGGTAPDDPDSYVQVATGLHTAIETLGQAERFTEGRVQSQETHRIILSSSAVTRDIQARDQIRHVTRDGKLNIYDLTGASDIDEDGLDVLIRATLRKTISQT